MIPPDWTPYRRVEDSELVGYLVSAAACATPLNLFGHPLDTPREPAAARVDGINV